MLRHVIIAFALSGVVQAGNELRLPTENECLFTGESDRFFMYVERTFEGETSRPWEAGTFGLVRNAVRLEDRVVLTKFHEGIDIMPLHRDGAGNPLDMVSSIADGRVVYCNGVAGYSNYGRYVVVEHTLENSALYSLYAHLAEITCAVGDPVKAGAVLGRMGFSGAGLNRARAHLHLEIGLLMSRNFDEWHKTSVGGVNRHGLFNGMNLAGFDPTRWFLDHKANPELSVSEFIAAIPVYFKVTVPSKGTPDFVTRYPWIRRSDAEVAASWEISFSATGLPLAFAPSQHQVEGFVVTEILPSTLPQRYLTRNLITGQGKHATLTPSGRKLVALLIDDFPIPSTATVPAADPKS
jgi:murein DD-endopeptidase MepM/ murein hydrolase activator NlpD